MQGCGWLRSWAPGLSVAAVLMEPKARRRVFWQGLVCAVAAPVWMYGVGRALAPFPAPLTGWLRGLALGLLVIGFLIALAAVTRGRRQRGSVAARLTMASLLAIGLRIGGYGVMGLAQSHQALVILFYLIPLLGAAGAAAVLAGYSPSALRARWKVQAA